MRQNLYEGKIAMKKWGIAAGVGLLLCGALIFMNLFFREGDLDKAEVNRSRVTFQYRKAKLEDSSLVELIKCVYDAEGLHVYLKNPQVTEKAAITCYDKEYYKMDNDWKFTFAEDHFTISGGDTYQIRGLAIGYIQLRELASKQYTLLEYTYAYDIGPMLVYGDPYAFYTERELEEQKQEEMEYFTKLSTPGVFEELEGVWVSEENPEMMLSFGYDEEKGKHFIHYTRKIKGASEATLFEDNLLFISEQKSGMHGNVLYVAYGRRNHGKQAFVVFSEDRKSITFNKNPGLTYVRANPKQ